MTIPREQCRLALRIFLRRVWNHIVLPVLAIGAVALVFFWLESIFSAHPVTAIGILIVAAVLAMVAVGWHLALEEAEITLRRRGYAEKSAEIEQEQREQARRREQNLS